MYQGLHVFELAWQPGHPSSGTCIMSYRQKPMCKCKRACIGKLVKRSCICIAGMMPSEQLEIILCQTANQSDIQASEGCKGRAEEAPCAPDQSGVGNSPLPGFVPQIGLGKQEEGHVWKRNRGLREVVADLCPDTNEVAAQHAEPTGTDATGCATDGRI
jgi:hypothetical protein